MLGKKQFEPKLFYSVQLEGLVPSDHELRRIESLIDFSFVRSKVKDLYSHTGQPSVDPEVVIKLLFLGYYYGILSERDLVKRAITDLSFRWFLGYDLDETVPTHSVLSKARTRYGTEIFQTVFDEVVGQCIKAGLVKGEQAFVDATYIEANASKSSIGPRLKVLNPSAYAGEMLNKAEENDEDKPASSPPDNVTDNKPASFNERMVSSTDPEATYRRGHPKKDGLYYEGHYLIDSKARVIVGATATDTTECADKQVQPLLLRARFRQDLRFDSLCADAEYGTQGLYQFLFSEGITPYIPPQKLGKNADPFSKEHFVYDNEQDIYRCPAGHKLVRSDYNVDKKTYVYRPATRDTCKGCSFRIQCVRGKSDRRIKRLLYQEAVDRARKITSDPAYKENMRLRRYLLEPLFGEAKEQHGLRRAQFRGLAKVKIQVLWTATILNIKRLLQHARHTAHSDAHALSSANVAFTELVPRFLTSLLNCQRTFSEVWI